jgi:hypothetical protein
MHALTAGYPTLSLHETGELATRRLTPRAIRFASVATDEDVALLNAVLVLEEECRREEWAALEHLLTLCQFGEGALDDRLRAFPLRAFGRAALDLYALGWVTTTEEE